MESGQGPALAQMYWSGAWAVILEMIRSWMITWWVATFFPSPQLSKILEKCLSRWNRGRGEANGVGKRKLQLADPAGKVSYWCNRNSGFFHDLILVQVLELNGIVWIITESVLANVLSTFKMDAVDSWMFIRYFWLNNSVDWNNYFVFDPKNSKNKNLCWVLWCSCIDFELGNLLLKFCIFASSTTASGMLLFFSHFFWRSGLSEYWILSYVLGHCFGFFLKPVTP